MYQAIDAISKAGVIQPLEPVSFEEDERLVILRLSRPQAKEVLPDRKGVDWRAFAGALRDSPHLNADPVAVQQEMRREWD